MDFYFVSCFQDVSGVGIPIFQLEDLFDGIEFAANCIGTVYIIRTVRAQLSSQNSQQKSVPDLHVLTVAFLALKKIVFLKKKSSQTLFSHCTAQAIAQN